MDRTISLRERLERSIVWWSLTMLVAGFCSGIAAYRWLIDASPPKAPQSARPAVEVTWPIKPLQTNVADVAGRLTSFEPDRQADLEVSLFVHPEDGTDIYFLNAAKPAKIQQDGGWYQLCRFGDEVAASNRGTLPLEFTVYAVVLSAGTKLPVDVDDSSLTARSEKDFIDQIGPHTLAISRAFPILRVPPSNASPPALYVSVSGPIALAWAEDVPMWVEIFHDGKRLRQGMLDPLTRLELESSPVPYEAKLSRKEGAGQSSLWVQVNGTKP